MSRPLLSIIIPTLNEELYIERCLESLHKQGYPKFEVIIVDSGSSDATVEIAERYGCRVLYEPRLGFAVAKNFGASEAKGKILVFTDADSMYPEDWLERIVRDFRDDEVVAVGGPLRPLEFKRGIHKLMLDITTNFIPRITSLFGFYIFQAPNQAFRKDAFKKVGGYDERLRILEDNELPNRIKKLGKVVFDPNLIVYSSVRRYVHEGYAKATLRFLKAYWEIYVKKVRKPEEYPLYR